MLVLVLTSAALGASYMGRWDRKKECTFVCVWCEWVEVCS